MNTKMNKQLAEQIDSLLALDERGALVPHSLPGLARQLLSRSSTALKGLHKIGFGIPLDLFVLIQAEADQRGATTAQTMAELYCEGQLAYARKAEVYDMTETVDRWTARFAQYTGLPGAVFLEVNAKRAQTVHEYANEHNRVTPSMDVLMVAVGLWSSTGVPL